MIFFGCPRKIGSAKNCAIQKFFSAADFLTTKFLARPGGDHMGRYYGGGHGTSDLNWHGGIGDVDIHLASSAAICTNCSFSVVMRNTNCLAVEEIILQYWKKVMMLMRHHCSIKHDGNRKKDTWGN